MAFDTLVRKAYVTGQDGYLNQVIHTYDKVKWWEANDEGKLTIHYGSDPTKPDIAVFPKGGWDFVEVKWE